MGLKSTIPKRFNSVPGSGYGRRKFLGSILGVTAIAALPNLIIQAAEEPPSRNSFPKIKLGIIGNGERGSWLAGLFQKHGGYELHAVADYFQDTADKCGLALGVVPTRRFSTLSGYKRLLESGVEAVALETPPHFFPEHARAAVEAGVHVYMAKPVASDVPGCLQILAASKEASRRKQCFLVDYQMTTDPSNQEVFRRLQQQGFGRIAQIATFGVGRSYPDPPKGASIVDRLRGLIWINDIALGCDYIGNYEIHAIDAALWVAGQRPLAAVGNSRICRPDPHGDSHDVCSVIFEYADGLIHNHFGQELHNQNGLELSCRVHGQTGNALLNYWGKAQFHSFDDVWSGAVDNLYEAGALRNIAAFYEDITRGRYENQTVPRAVDGALTCILGREAAMRGVRLTMEELLKENKRLEVSLAGLKA